MSTKSKLIQATQTICEHHKSGKIIRNAMYYTDSFTKAIHELRNLKNLYDKKCTTKVTRDFLVKNGFKIDRTGNFGLDIKPFYISVWLSELFTGASISVVKYFATEGGDEECEWCSDIEYDKCVSVADIEDALDLTGLTDKEFEIE